MDLEPTKTLTDLSTEISDILGQSHNPYRGFESDEKFTRFYTANYWITDTDRVVSSLSKKGFSSSLDRKFLEIFGFLQSIYIQQSCIDDMYKTINGVKITDTEKGEDWLKIRAMRNQLSGHPISSAGEYHILINPSHSNIFELHVQRYETKNPASEYSKRTTREIVKIFDLSNRYNQAAIRALSQVCCDLVLMQEAR